MPSSHLSALDFEYSALESVHLGESAPGKIAALVAASEASSILLIGSSSLAKITENFSQITNTILQELPEVAIEVFSDIGTHTPREDVLAALDIARANKIDLLISVGGGSIIDACKAVQLALQMNVSTADELKEFAQQSDGSRGSKAGDFSLFKKPSSVRQIAVPTTLSGAEFSNNAGVLNTQNSSKEGYKGPQLCPRSIVYDPHLAMHTPDWLWFSTAIRSLDHAIEGLCSEDCNAFVEAHFLHAIKLFAESLPTAFKNPKDPVPRQMNQNAVWLACCGLGKISHGASHGIGYILGSLCGVPHGHTSCVMLPAVLQFNLEETKQQQESIAAALGKPELSAADAVRNLVRSLDLPTSLQEVGVQSDQLEEIARRAALHPVVQRNPRLIGCPDHVLEILQLAWSS